MCVFVSMHITLCATPPCTVASHLPQSLNRRCSSGTSFWHRSDHRARGCHQRGGEGRDREMRWHKTFPTQVLLFILFYFFPSFQTMRTRHLQIKDQLSTITLLITSLFFNDSLSSSLLKCKTGFLRCMRSGLAAKTENGFDFFASANLQSIEKNSCENLRMHSTSVMTLHC